MTFLRATMVAVNVVFLTAIFVTFARSQGVDPDDERTDVPSGCYFLGTRLICENGVMPSTHGSPPAAGGLDLVAPPGDESSAEQPNSNRAPSSLAWPLDPAGNAPVAATRSLESQADGRDQSGKATRVFSGPSQYPPHEFAAYAIIVFKSRVLPEDRLRRINACRGYTKALLTPSEASVSRSRQLVTVWPVRTDEVAERIMSAEASEPCISAVDEYGLRVATDTLDDVRTSRHVSPADLSRIEEGRGPFIFAWNPGETKGEADALILRVDMSDVATASRFRDRFVAWRDDVEARQSLWIDGWREVDIWEVIGTWADRWGGSVMTAMGWGREASQ